MEKNTLPLQMFGEVRFVLGYCQIVLSLALYSSAWQLAGWWMTVTHSSETWMVKAMKVLIELTLGLILSKQLLTPIFLHWPALTQVPGLNFAVKLLAVPPETRAEN